jgi:50S ribosomal subunit-associated GTPase HflX
MESARGADERRIRRRIAAIQKRLEELSEMWDCTCSSDAQYRMVEAEREALRMEKGRLCEIKGDL